MDNDLHFLLAKYRTHAKTKREQGAYFEKLVKVFLSDDPVYKINYKAVYTYGEWASANGLKAQDTGIDLVAKNHDDDFYTAIQCKFYAPDRVIQKSDLDGFFAASSTHHFSKRLFVDTTNCEWSKNALKILENQTAPCRRLSLKDLQKSPIKWDLYIKFGEIKRDTKKILRPHQKQALANVIKGLNDVDRGKLIMACGTGKTLTALRIAEELAGVKKNILYLVPSLSLMNQTIREWANDSNLEINPFAVCSDAQISIRRTASDDHLDTDIHDLVYPATTDSKKLSEAYLKNLHDHRMNVVYATYQSIDVLSKAQKEFNFPEFDFVICDEAHRTTGAKIKDQRESRFTKIHSNDHIKAKKRLYMTATPKVYSEAVKEKATEADAVLLSMDNAAYYGDEFYRVSFDYAVEHNLLCDYKVIIWRNGGYRTGCR
ncbi:MAG: DEAD/DEAH box helicase family protein [Pseudomonadota bacterium]